MNAKKQARRERAAKRFNIMTFTQYIDFMVNTASWPKFIRFNKLAADGTNEGEYAAYVERKKQEAAALGL